MMALLRKKDARNNLEAGFPMFCDNINTANMISKKTEINSRILEISEKSMENKFIR